MTIEQLVSTIKETRENISEYSTEELTELEWRFVRYYAETSTELADIKSQRAQAMMDIRKRLSDGGKCTEKMVENEYYASQNGMWLVKQDVLLDAVGKMISAIRSRKNEIIRIG